MTAHKKDELLHETKAKVSEEIDFCLECWQPFFIDDLYMGVCDDCYESKIGSLEGRSKRKKKFDDEQ